MWVNSPLITEATVKISSENGIYHENSKLLYSIILVPLKLSLMSVVHLSCPGVLVLSVSQALIRKRVTSEYNKIFIVPTQH